MLILYGALSKLGSANVLEVADSACVCRRSGFSSWDFIAA